MKIAIVIPCFNRVKSLSNLIKSILNAKIEQEIDIVFSIDYSGNDEVGNFVDSVIWRFGNKRVIKHPQNIGLRSNILFCGDLLLSEYERIIVLEDDLLVAPDFVNYSLRAADFYDKSTDIAGISLFSYYSSEEGLFQFYPLKDDYDTFFIQWPSSWGQLWTRNQWKNFRQWFSFDYSFTKVNLPQSVKKWNESWKKYYAAYLVEKNKFFVYPYYSLSEEQCSPGVHFDNDYNYSYFNNSLQLGTNLSYRFREFTRDTLFRYDCFFQLFHRPIIINNRKINVSFDLYGTKNPDNIETEFVITSKAFNGVSPIFGNSLLPFELNVLLSVEGKTFSILNKQQYSGSCLPIIRKRALRILMGGKDMMKFVISRLKTGIRSRR